MIKICGTNEFHQLGEASNATNDDGDESVYPPIELHLDVSTILSFSSYNDHTIIVTCDKIAQAIGSNEDGKICSSLPKEVFDQFTKLTITNAEGHSLVPISAVCGYLYTLYLVSNPESSDKLQLAYFYSDSSSDLPFFLNIGDRKPLALFGGYENSAVIDSEGAIIFIPDYESSIDTFKSTFEPTFLPDDQKAVKICCCDDFAIALSSNGRLYFSEVPEEGNQLHFSIVKELESEVIINVSGTCLHCLAVTNDGRVFALGSNNCGQLGLGSDVVEASDFTRIESLSKYKIDNVFAGGVHSLFLTDRGKVLACGSNNYAQLPIEKVGFTEKVFEPRETVVTEGASFCIAGDSMSAVFMKCDPPNSPNKKITV